MANRFGLFPPCLQSRFALSVIGVTGGSVLAQAVLVVGSAAITRLVTPGEFAAFSVSASLAGIAAVVLVASYPSIIPIADGDQQVTRLAWLTLCITAVLTVGLTLAVEAIFRLGHVETVFGLDRRLTALTIMSATAIAVWTLARSLLVRHRRFRVLATTTVWGNLIQVCSQIVMSVMGFGAGGLILGFLVGRSTNAGQMLARQTLRPRPSLLRLRLEATRWGWLPVQLTVPLLINQATVWAVTPIVSAWYGATFAGLFALAFRVLVLPLTLLGTSISTVVFPETAERHRAGSDSAPLLTATARLLLNLGVPVFGAIVLLGPEAFALLFGQEWRGAGEIAAVLAPWMALGLASSSISSFATVRQRFGQILVIGILEGSLRLGALAIGARANDASLGTALYSLSGVIIATTWIAWVLHQAGVDTTCIRRTLAPALTTLVVVCVAAALGRRLLTEPAYLAASLAMTASMLTWAVRRARALVAHS